MSFSISPGWSRGSIALAATAAALAAVGSGPPPVAVAAAPAASGELAGVQSSMAAPVVLRPSVSRTPREPSAAQLAASQAFMAMAASAWASRGASLRAGAMPSEASLAGMAGPPSGSATSAVAPGEAPAASASRTPGDFVVHLRSDLAPPLGFSSSVNEPAVAQSGRGIFYTHNWYAARSRLHGTAPGAESPWFYISPYDDMNDFCCDQDTVYDRGRDVVIWYRQGVIPAGQTENRVRVGVSANAGESFCMYDVQPSDLGLASRWFDYPRLGLSNNYLYIATNVFNTGGGFSNHALLRWPLDALASCSGFSYFYWFPPSGWTPAPVGQARETMYLGDNPVVSVPLNNLFRVLWQPESSAQLFWTERTIAPYSFTQGDGTCPVPGGANPCQRADQRIIGAVLARDQLDFFWNAKEGNGFPLPYVEAAGFDTGTLSYNARKLLWFDQASWHYAAAASNDREHVGLSAMLFWTQFEPGHYVAIDDDFNGTPPGWENSFVQGGTQNWTGNASGDYLRAWSSAPQGVGWVGTGYTRQVGAYVPHFVEWRRARDERGTQRFELK
jgi:hypothetical protein